VEEENEKEMEDDERTNKNLACELESKRDENHRQNKPRVEKQAIKPHPMVNWQQLLWLHSVCSVC